VKLTDQRKAAPKECMGGELRRRVNEDGGERGEEAMVELRRRLSNLTGAVIPEWERKARGRDPRRWKLA